MKRILTAICLITLCAILLVSCDSAPSTNSDNYEYYTYQTDYNNYATSNEYAATGNYSPLPTEKAQTNAKPEAELVPVPVETITNPKKECSLEIPDLPVEINYYSKNSLTSSVHVTQIIPTFETLRDGTITLTIKYSGTKTYDYQGSNQSSPCYIGWKLYDSDGNVLDSGALGSPKIATGESFANKSAVLIHSSDEAEPGAYKLVLLDVN